MSRRRAFKLIHLTGTVWLILCIGHILVAALRQAGFDWWIIFSLSGHSAVIVFLLVSLYLFAIFRGTRPSQQIEAEHPLTSTPYYKMFYVVTPFLGSFSGLLSVTGANTTGEYLSGISLGTLATTFLVWVIVDPVTGLAEMTAPASRKHRAERLAGARTLRQEHLQEKKHLLAMLLRQERQNRRKWQQLLQPYAEQLATLLDRYQADPKRAEDKAVDLGVNAWQIGGLNCMQQLRDMVVEICENRSEGLITVDYLSSWWDGIGTWRKPSLQEIANP